MALITGAGEKPADHLREMGFTVVELLVAMTLALLGLALAAQLLLESQHTYALAGREARNPLVGYAVAQLRNDIRRSAVASGDGASLVLSGHPAGAIRWEAQGERLVRSVVDAEGRIRRRTVLRSLSRWSWNRQRGPDGNDLVHVDLGYRRHSTALLVTSPRLPRDRLEEETLSLTLSPRGGVRVDRW